MDCEKAGSLMMKYMDGVLTDVEALSLNHHMQTCGHCLEDFMAYDSIINGFSEMTLSEPPEDFENNVMAIIRQLPEAELKPASKQLYGIWGVFSVLLGLGIILDMFKDSLLSWMSQYPQFEPLLNIYTSSSDAVNGISIQVSAALSQAFTYMSQAGASLSYVALMLFIVLAAAQVVIYRRERAVGK